MSGNGVLPMGGLSSPLPFYRPGDCPPSAPCFGTVGRTAERKPYEATQLSNAEASTLRRAADDAEAELGGAKDRLDDRVQALAATQGRIDLALHDLSAFDTSRQVALVRAALHRVELRHQHDGPEDRRHRPAWIRLLLWPTIGAAALYDTVFLADVFLELVDGAYDATNWRMYVALLPGLLLTVALLVAGHWLAEAFSRHRGHRERQPTRARRLFGRRISVDERAADDLPWPLWPVPLIFAVLVLGIVMLWAVIRGITELVNDDYEPKPFAIALLLLLFSLAAITVKVLHHNRFADDAADKAAAMNRIAKEYRDLAREGSAAIESHVGALQRLGSELDALEGRARWHLDQAWVRILGERDRHGLAGMVAPPFSEVARVACGASSEPCAHLTFADIGEPQVCLRLVTGAREVLTTYEPAVARKELARLLDAVTAQWAPPDGPG